MALSSGAQYGIGGLSGALGGAAAGTAIAPGAGTVAGGFIGLGAGLIGTALDIEEQEERQRIVDQALAEFEEAQAKAQRQTVAIEANAQEAVRAVATAKQASDTRKADVAREQTKQVAAQQGLTPAEIADAVASTEVRVAEASAAASPAVMNEAMAGLRATTAQGIQKIDRDLSSAQSEMQFKVAAALEGDPTNYAAMAGQAIGAVGMMAGSLRGAGIDPLTMKEIEPGAKAGSELGGALGGAAGATGAAGSALGKGTAPGSSAYTGPPDSDFDIDKVMAPDYMPSWTDPGHPDYSARAVQEYKADMAYDAERRLQPEVIAPTPKRDTGVGRDLERSVAQQHRSMLGDVEAIEAKHTADQALGTGLYKAQDPTVNIQPLLGAPTMVQTTDIEGNPIMVPKYEGGGMAGTQGPEIALLGEEGPELVLNAKQTQELAGALGGAEAYKDGGVAGTKKIKGYDEGGVAGTSRISHMGSGITERQAGTADPKALPRQDESAGDLFKHAGGGARRITSTTAPLGGSGSGTQGIPARFLGPSLRQQEEEEEQAAAQLQSGAGLPMSYEELSSYITQINWLVDMEGAI